MITHTKSQFNFTRVMPAVIFSLKDLLDLVIKEELKFYHNYANITVFLITKIKI